MKVRATRLGYYNFERRREGCVFEISDERWPEDYKDPKTKRLSPKAGLLKDFSEKWMVEAGPDEPYDPGMRQRDRRRKLIMGEMRSEAESKSEQSRIVI